MRAHAPGSNRSCIRRSARAAQREAAARGPYQIIVVPLLVESGAARQYDRVLLVDCDESAQRARLAQRDGSSAQLVDAALAAQASRADAADAGR